MMFGTTVLMYLVMLMIWETNIFLATGFLLFFGFIDMVYTTGEIKLPPPSPDLTCHTSIGDTFTMHTTLLDITVAGEVGLRNFLV